MAPGAGNGLGAPAPSLAQLSVGYVCSLVVSTTSPDPNPDSLSTTDKQIKNQVSEKMQILCHPRRPRNTCAISKGVMSPREMFGKCDHVTQPLCSGHMGGRGFPTELRVSDREPKHKQKLSCHNEIVSHVTGQFFSSMF